MVVIAFETVPKELEHKLLQNGYTRFGQDLKIWRTYCNIGASDISEDIESYCMRNFIKMDFAHSSKNGKRTITTYRATNNSIQ